jgi:hypothetical protein
MWKFQMTHCLIKNMYANKLFEIGIIYYFLYVMFFWELSAVASNCASKEKGKWGMNHRSEWKPNSWGMFLAVRCQHASGACQSHFCPLLSLREASRKYVELSPSTPPFLTLQFHKKDLPPTPNLLQTGWYSLHLGIIFQSPQGNSGDMGQSDDLVSLLLEVIVDVMDDSTYKLAVFGATSGLGQEVC